MLKPLTIAVVAASVWAAAIALPATALAKDAEAATVQAMSSSAFSARAQATAPVIKRVRKQPRRVAAVAAPSPYHSQCFLFFCQGSGRPFHFLVLGVAY